MELVHSVFDGEHATVATLKFGSHYPEVEKVRARSMLLEITRDNREQIYRKLIEQVDGWTGR